MQPVVAKLRELTERFEQMNARVEELDKVQPGYKEFHARRLVETAGHIIIPYLLARQAGEEAEYVRSAQIYCKLAEARIAEAYTYLMHSEPSDTELFRQVEQEYL